MLANTLKKHGLTPEYYGLLLRAQKGVCAICGEPPKKRRLAIDHCHKTGRIRGLLCGRCNTGIGNLRENPRVLRAAIAYLQV